MKGLDVKQIDAEAILDSLNDGVVTIGLDKRIKYLNRAAERLLGYTLEEAQEMPCAAVVHCTACENNCLLDQTLSTGRRITHYETVLQDKLGRVVRVSSNTTLLKDLQGRVIGGVEVIRDCSQIQALNEALKGKYSFENIIGKNHQMREIYAALPTIAGTNSTILIEGGPGTGKELLAHAIHQNSPRSDKPFVKVSCGMMPEPLLAGELFGHTPGAFAGALTSKAGQFESANGGTLFLDHIEALSPATQARLLNVLQEGTVERLGDTRRIRVDVRVIAAAHQDLQRSAEQGEFRPDLYDRLRTISIRLPRLRQRRDDIPLLIRHFLDRFNAEMGKTIESVSSEAMDVLLNHDYPVNVQELENIVEHAALLCQGRVILPAHLPRDIFDLKDDFVDRAIRRDDPFKTIERQLVLKVLSQTGWSLKEAAERLKISRTTLWRRIKDFGIDRPASKSSNDR